MEMEKVRRGRRSTKKIRRKRKKMRRRVGRGGKSEGESG